MLTLYEAVLSLPHYPLPDALCTCTCIRYVYTVDSVWVDQKDCQVVHIVFSIVQTHTIVRQEASGLKPWSHDIWDSVCNSWHNIYLHTVCTIVCALTLCELLVHWKYCLDSNMEGTRCSRQEYFAAW